MNDDKSQLEVGHLSSLGQPAAKRGQILDLSLSQAVPLAAALIGTLLTARLLGPQGRGDLALIVGTANVVGALVFSSVHIGTARAVIDGNTEARARLEGWALVAAAGGLLIAALVWLLLPPAFSVGAFTRSTTVLAIAGGGLVTLNLVVLRTAQALGDSRAFRNGWLVQALLYPAIGIPAAAVTRHPFAVVACWSFATIASTVAVRLHFRRPPTKRNFRARRTTLRIVAASLPAHVAVVGQQMLLRADIVLLGALTTASSVGYYSVATTIAGLVLVVAEVAGLFVLQRGMRMSNGTSKLDLLKVAYQNYAPISIAVAAIVGAATLVCVPIALPEYAPAIPLALILLPGAVIQGFARIALALLSTEPATRLLLGLGIVNILLATSYVPAIMAFGQLGAACTSTFLYTVQSIMMAIAIVPILRRGDRERSSEGASIQAKGTPSG